MVTLTIYPIITDFFIGAITVPYMMPITGISVAIYLIVGFLLLLFGVITKTAGKIFEKFSGKR